jgi:hypothetical protein
MGLPFEQYEKIAWPHWYRGRMVVRQICGGVPANPNIAQSWIRAKLKDTRSAVEVQALIDNTVEELRVTNAAAGRTTMEDGSQLVDGAIEKVASTLTGLSVFKRTEDGVLYIEGRQLKAAIKEAAAVAANAGKISTKNWGNPDNPVYRKQLKGWLPEHVFVPEQILVLRKEDGTLVKAADGTNQKFVHTHRGDAISHEEFVNDAVFDFTVKTDVELSDKDWAMIWLTGQDQGIGASRSQGFGVYRVTEWEKTKVKAS